MKCLRKWRYCNH